jgi:hypothetical protein
MRGGRAGEKRDLWDWRDLQVEGLVELRLGMRNCDKENPAIVIVIGEGRGGGRVRPSPILWGDMVDEIQALGSPLIALVTEHQDVDLEGMSQEGGVGVDQSLPLG